VVVAERPYCRLTVLAPRRRVDVALPADVPVAELVPMVLDLVGEPGPGARRPEPWRLSGAAGGPLPPGATLVELGVLDGELLRIAPDAPPPAPPVFDDPVDALAATAGATPAGGFGFGPVAVLVPAVAAAVLLAGARGSAAAGFAALLAALTAVAAVAYAVRLARMPGDPAALQVRLDAARTIALVAVPAAAAAGWVALSGAPATSLVLAAAAAGTAAAVAQVALRVVAPSLVGVVVAAGLVTAGALAVRFGVAPTASAAAVGAVAVVAGPLLPRAALRLAGLPRPVVPADAGELVDADEGPDLLPPDELVERTDLARGYLAGLAGGCAGAAAAGAVIAAAGGGWAGPAFAGVTVVVLVLRARSFVDPDPARTLLGCAVAAGIGLATVVVTQAGQWGRLAAGAALLLAVAGGAVATGRTRPVASPVSRRAVDLLEGALVAAALPLAFGAMDLYRLVRGL